MTRDNLSKWPTYSDPDRIHKIDFDKEGKGQLYTNLGDTYSFARDQSHFPH